MVWYRCFKFPSLRSRFACPRRNAARVLMAKARSGNGATHRAQPEHGEYPPFAMRFMEALEGRSSESGDKGCRERVPLPFGERSEPTNQNCRPTRAAH